MADLFNVMFYSKDRDPYNNPINGMAEKAYFPLSYVICYGLSVLSSLNWYIEKNEGITYTGSVQSLQSMPIVIGVFFISVLLVILAVQFFEMVEADKWKKYLIMLIVMGSGTMMFTYERGNLILLALIGVLLFLMSYDSDVKWFRELGYLGLAIAGALKGYPAILGILLIYRHEWKEVIRLLIYGVVLAFGPFLLLKGGFSNIPIWLDNLRANSDLYMFLRYPRVGYYYFIANTDGTTNEDKMALVRIWKPIIMGIGIYSVVSSLFQNRKWLQICTLLTFIIIYPANSGLYCLIYLLPVIILYLNDNKKRWTDMLYLPIFMLVLTPLQIIIRESNYTLFLDNTAIILLIMMCLVENTICLVRSIREKTFSARIRQGIKI
ncbi:MAG: DUF2029 domain-containing protein [Lachnospiraceae bacterium]|nr:DUF2029 domain-containing protein [Lachnospiraceae bacterium]